MSGEVFILTTIPPDGPGAGGMERFVSYLAAGLGERGYRVRIFHEGNSVPPWWRQSWRGGKLAGLLVALMQGYFIGRAVKQALHPSVRLVLSNSTVGWYPLGDSVRQAHFYHGTYRGQAEAIRPFITYKGYLGLKWYSSMMLERWSGRGKLCLCNSDQTRDEVSRFFGQAGCTVWCPLDTQHFRSIDKAISRYAIGLPQEEAVGLFVGSIHPMKGFPIVQALIESFPPVHWLLALRGELPQNLDGQPNVTVFQNASYEQLPLLYNAADVSLCPSRYEPFGYVVAEALACGVPLVATPGGASRLFLSEFPLNELVIQSPDDVAHFQKATSIVLSDPKYYQQVVRERVRFRLKALMAPENWWQRFLSVTGLEGGM